VRTASNTRLRSTKVLTHVCLVTNYR
jgi:hypothetical protein